MSPSLTARQDDAQGARLLQALHPYALTKIEKLQIVNLTPLRPVELYVVCTPFYLHSNCLFLIFFIDH